jgi:hypothetical protein
MAKIGSVASRLSQLLLALIGWVRIRRGDRFFDERAQRGV